MSRHSWDETWMRVAGVMAGRSRCVRAQVGAVIVDQVNRIVATGYNGMPAGYHRPPSTLGDEKPCDRFCPRAKHGPADPTSYGDCIALHAEANALSFCDRRHREGGTIYVTGQMCWDCAKLVANSGLQRAVVLHELGREYREADRGIELLRACGITVTVVEDR